MINIDKISKITRLNGRNTRCELRHITDFDFADYGVIDEEKLPFSVWESVIKVELEKAGELYDRPMINDSVHDTYIISDDEGYLCSYWVYYGDHNKNGLMLGDEDADLYRLAKKGKEPDTDIADYFNYLFADYLPNGYKLALKRN